MKENYYKKLEPIIKKAGKKALKDWYKFSRTNTELKEKTQIVTKTDKDTEKYLVKNIKAHFPDHAFLGEEFGKSKNKSDYTWIIDPIDGTTNFSIHNPLWSISIGLAYKNEIIFGIIYIPSLEEMFWAEKDKGAKKNNKKIELNKRQKNEKLIHTFCHGSGLKNRKVALEYHKQQKLNSLDCRQLGSAAIELCFVAFGRVDSIFIPGAKSWDVAAGALIAKEAGAEVVDYSGKDWNLKSKEIIACHPEIKRDLLKKINKIKNNF